ncbi:antiterminator Q family protein [Rhodoferax sp. TS-BS-61-7]|uniref:antiterminator Q family protein n=1 Tax=Rhodoferax sp. TS-BS-61-7 TaxID=2094194 RepID=UPI000CF5DD48|nr:antiterminator Q family protein [Rhodoferax sp. TS-BS-61-7]PQA78701.1 hypothetical protein C5F53_01610 [Rhodoferax sp. TS-BS-61-7]
MARIEYIRHRLEEWGRWCQQSESGALGYPSQSAFARMGPSAGRNESVVPTIALQASEIDDAVKSLQLTQSHLYLVVKLTYADGLPRHLVAKRMARADSTIKANLAAADQAISRWLEDKAELQRKAADSRQRATQ